MKKLTAFLILSVVLFSGCIGSSVKVESPIKSCKMVDVPYQEQVAYTESEPYQATEEYQVDLKSEVTSTKKDTTYHGLDVWAVGIIRVRNVDSESGIFTVQQTFSTLNRGSKTLTSNQYIMPGETKEFRAEFDISMGEDFNVNYVVIPPKKTLTRTVTKYRDVTKYRTETKYRKEEKCG